MSEQNLEREADEKYKAWLEDRHNPGLQTDAWIVLNDFLEKKPDDWKTLTRLAYVSSYRSGGYSFAIQHAKKASELRPENMLIKLFIADTFYMWGLDIKDSEKLEKVWNLYNMIFQENPVFSYFHDVTERKLRCIKKLWEYKKQ